MATLENKYVEKLDAHYTRIIFSWLNSGGAFFGEFFEDWCVNTLGLSEEQFREINDMALMGKFELEHSARKYLRDHESEIKEWLED